MGRPIGLPLSAPQSSANRATTFPEGFLWGAATSGHQVEGNNVNSDIWVLEHVTPTAYSEASGDADNSFEMWPHDMDLVASLGLNAYRFSLEWSRIEPEPDQFSIAMLDHYKAMIEGCRKRGLTPIVTFNHYTVPRWFAAKGSWAAEDGAKLFGRFCDTAARHLAQGIGYATTLNEPNLMDVMQAALTREQIDAIRPMLNQMLSAAARYVGSSRFIPGNGFGIDDARVRTANMVAAHHEGRQAIKAARPDLPVGVSLAIADDRAVGEDSVRDQKRAAQYGAWLEAARGDDFLGVQNYERNLWDAHGKVEAPASPDRNASGAAVYPDSLAGAVRYAHAVAGIPILVTEHGIDTEDDALRERFIRSSLGGLASAIDEGVPILGYVHWSLLDNFEWLRGFKPKFGLVGVDRTTFGRVPKRSAHLFGAIARSNGSSIAILSHNKQSGLTVR